MTPEQRKAMWTKKVAKKTKTYRCYHCGNDHVNGGTCARAKKDYGVKFDKGYRSLQKIKKKEYGTSIGRKIDYKKADKYGNVT